MVLKSSLLGWIVFLLSGYLNNSLKNPQLIQNAATTTVPKKVRKDHNSPILALLPWLPVKVRIKSKILFLTYKSLNN